jgi:murein DD-endopeptidase MepM/ murein hydrolase activator NlpD
VGLKLGHRTERETSAYDWTRAGAVVTGVLALAFIAFTTLATLQSRQGQFGWLGEATPAEPATPLEADTGPITDVRDVEVERGDTLSGLLVDEGTTSDDAQGVAAAIEPVFDPSGLRGGQVMTLTFRTTRAPDAVPVLMSLDFKPNAEREIRVFRNDDGTYRAEQTVKDLKPVATRAQGTIDGSLYQSAKASNVPDAVIVDLIRIYSHAVDFQREVKAGDHFDVLYTTYVDEHGDVIKGGAIDYAQLTLSGKDKPLFRFTSETDQTTDYYTPEGQSGKRMLMRTPIDGARLTSGYGMRMHPILGYTKMHKGVDFSAPTGTPIMAAGNGTIKFARWFGTFGKYVRLKHTGNYETAYAHMSRFAPGIREGARVRQGQIIGYVGTTGRSTGPHLHYEVLSRELQINPMDVRIPTGTVLAGADLDAFKAHVAKVQSALENWGKNPALVAQGEILRAKLLP